MLTKQDLLDFNKEIIEVYEKGVIKSPIHLQGSVNNEYEKFLINLFKEYEEGDWIFSNHRSHFHWLLSGRSKEELKNQILEGHSMHIFGDKFFTSAIVAGISPIALGVAKALKLKGSRNKVWCFLGDAAYNCGLTLESIKYAEGFDLPILYIIEDNGFSVRAVTQDTWGTKNIKNKVKKHSYKRKYPHSGTGKYIMF
jgi:pyruvate dehydrogenase E1 component alpha subunit